jgi:predicted dithiol-disulfide oxidoreductase (DUF899 family)
MTLTFPGESAEYRRARDQLLDDEIELRRAMERVAVARRALPLGGAVPEDYEFVGADGRVRLSELFDGHRSLAIYHWMFPRHAGDDRPAPPSGPLARWPLEETPCPSCTALLDQLDGAAAHVAQNLSLVVVAGVEFAPMAVVAEDRGWRNLRLVSSAGNTFRRDYHGDGEHGPDPMLNVFTRAGDGTVRHSWSSELLFAPTDPGQDPRHVGTLEPLWNLFDLTPEGRPDGWEEQLSYDP